MIRDTGSRNGTLVNGVPVTEHWLKHGDQVAIGDSVFVFLLAEETDEQIPNPFEFDDELTRATAQIRPQDVLYLQRASCNFPPGTEPKRAAENQPDRALDP